ncbi:SCO family protein [Neobacillus mesonae]|uniref:SCO family protein n=1 Tax=Neobacillus mesonae TaxID=1193713 RepID=UPI00203D52E2|nr:SCO family protein [Neobacillus mesonae]MCM3567792.1 SCO family protein [Neobacillus mesonae]
MKKIILFMFCIGLLSACSQEEPKKPAVNFPLEMQVENFEGTNQDGKPISLSTLKGKVWVADFIFTNCDTVCSPMTANMAQLQQELAAENVKTELISYSIDPDHDQPKILKQYAGSVGADFSNWNLVTGYKQEFIESFANKSFMAPAAKLEGSNQFVHSTNFYLVNQEGVVVQKYEGVTNPPYEQIVKDVKSLQ